MVLVLLLLCVVLSVATVDEQHPTGLAAARQLAGTIEARFGKSARVLIVVRQHAEDVAFADELARELDSAGIQVVQQVRGEPADARRALREIAARGEAIQAIACNQVTSSWGVFDNLGAAFPSLAAAQVVRPESYNWPNFLKTDNLLNVANQIAVIAIIAIGMTLVIITGGIDLSVGSLVALSAVVTARLVRDLAGGYDAAPLALVLCCLGGIGVCGLIGLFSGVMVTAFRMPPFIVTLALLLVASGQAFTLANGESISQLPDTFAWLGGGASLLHVPNPVVLKLSLYLLAHLVMTRTVFGRHVYAVGGNPTAARLCGIPVRRVLLLVYAISGTLAGLSGVILASQLKSGAPTYGNIYEMYVIAAVVVGGTSLSGGRGNIFGTLIGALIIGVIQNGMNLIGVSSHPQRIVLGFVILGAVLLDQLKIRLLGDET
jgi:ribose transport system permease protein